MSQQKPKKPRPKSKRLKLSRKEEWTKILKEVEKNEIPVNVLKSLTVNLKDGTSVSIDVVELMHQGLSPDFIEKEINQKLRDLDMYIDDVDFFINVDSVSQVVQSLTDKLLKDL